MWTDNETTSDLIGFRVHADLIRSVVMDATLLPATIGVFGDWGGGKTSIMRMLEQDLQPERYADPPERDKYERIACLYFNGWLFEGYDDAKAALLSSVLIALGEHKRFGPKVRDKAASLLKSVNWMRVARLGLKEVGIPVLAAYVTGGASALPSLASVFGRLTGGVFGGGGTEVAPADTTQVSILESPAPKETKKDQIDWESLVRKDTEPAGPLDVRSFRDRFAALLKDSDIDTLIVLIDDLDRCSPERLIENLEAIKLFLNVPRTAFVIGADPRIVRHAIASRYHTGDVIEESGGPEAQERLVTDYLEKLIQVPYWLPRLSPAEIETYMALLFCSRHLDAPLLSKCLKASEAQRNDNRYGAFGYAAVQSALEGQELAEELADSLTFSSSAAPLITEGLKGNPRQVKRFLNAYMLRKRLATIAKLTNVRDDVLVKLMILEYSQARAFRQLFEWQAAQGGLPAEIQAMESGLPGEPGGKEETPPGAARLPWTSDFLLRWIRMDPQLAEVDLRDYFWIARDRLASTFAGLSMVPPVVRRAVEDLLSDNPGRRPAGLTAASSMDGTERAVLLDLLSTQVTRHPGQKVGYDAFRALIERNIPDVVEVLAEVAGKVPPARFPPAVALDLKALVSGRPATKQVLQPVLDSLAKTSTPAGRALKPPSGKGR